MAAPAKYVARIAAKQEIEMRPREGPPVKVLRITYAVPGWPPRTIWLKADEATKENVKAMIKADVESLLGREVELEVEGL
jgi:hypothetical protein